MQLVGLALALAGLAAGEALKKLDTSLTILVHNDLQGTAPDGSRLSLKHTDLYEQERQTRTQTRP